MNGYTGLLLCLTCTNQLFDPNKLDANCAPGIVIAVDAAYSVISQKPLVNYFPHWRDDEFLFGSDYKAEREMSYIQFHSKLRLDFDVKNIC